MLFRAKGTGDSLPNMPENKNICLVVQWQHSGFWVRRSLFESKRDNEC